MQSLALCCRSPEGLRQGCGVLWCDVMEVADSVVMAQFLGCWSSAFLASPVDTQGVPRGHTGDP